MLVLVCGTTVAARGASPAAASEQLPPAGDRGTFLTAAETTARRLPRLHCLLVSIDGRVELERCNGARTPTQLANVKSVSKSVVSALVGIALDRGVLTGLSQPLRDFYPELAKTAPDKGAITIEDLVSMRAGLESTSSRNYGAWVRSPNWVRYALARPLLDPPGTRMEYSTGNTHLLSAILTKATRSNTWAFAQEALARPLGFTLARWMRDPQGIYFGGNEMQLTPRQMLAFGEVYLRRGRSGDRQVIPAEWIDASFVPRGRSGYSGQSYGYGWWIRTLAGETVYYAWGFGGQFVFVVPRLSLVVVTTSATAVSDERRDHRDALYDLLTRDIIVPVRERGGADRAAGVSPR